MVLKSEKSASQKSNNLSKRSAIEFHRRIQLMHRKFLYILINRSDQASHRTRIIQWFDVIFYITISVGFDSNNYSVLEKKEKILFIKRTLNRPSAHSEATE